MEDILKRTEPFLAPCGSCDAGLPIPCTHPDDDYRPVMLDLVREVERLRLAEEDRVRPRYRIKVGDHQGRIGRRTKIDIKAHPFQRQAHVYTIVFPEGDSARLWAWACEKVT